MLKTLRIASIFAVVLAAVGVIAVVLLGLKGDPEVKNYLAKPGIVDELRKKYANTEENEPKTSPLIDLSKAFALRIDPPPPPKPPTPVTAAPKPADTVKRDAPKPTIPVKKVVSNVKYDLLATVVYESSPEKSLALLQTAGDKQEWFRQGEKVGHLELSEIRDGSVIFTQGGKNPQETFVPVKPQVKSLLRADQTTSASPTGPGSITVQTTPSGQESIPAPVSGPSSGETVVSEEPGTDTDRTTRMIDRTSPPKPDVSSRIHRVRSAPPQPSPEEQKESIDKTLSDVEKIMNREDDLLSEEDREKEKEMWQTLLKELNKEKERLDTAAKEAEPSGAEADKGDTEKDESTQPEKSDEKKAPEAAKPAPAEPDKP